MKQSSRYKSSSVSPSFLKLERLLVLLVAIVAMLLPAVLLKGANQQGTSQQAAVQNNAAVVTQPEATQPTTRRVALADDKPADAAEQTPVKVAVLTYAKGKTSQCFAPGFLTTVSRHTRIVVQKEFSQATLGQANLHQYPFVIMTGEEAFTLSDEEKQSLKTYLQRGGFLLASAGCSNEPWAQSFTKTMKEIFPERQMEKLAMDHPVFHSIYDFKSLPGRKSGSEGHIDGLSLGGRLVALFSPLGLNDTENAGGGCCCCGGNELKDAHRINANILAYVLTH